MTMIRTLPAAFLMCLSPVLAGTDDVLPAAVDVPGEDEWKFEAVPYAWLIGLDGTIGINGIYSDSDATFDWDVAMSGIGLGLAIRW